MLQNMPVQKCNYCCLLSAEHSIYSGHCMNQIRRHSYACCRFLGTFNGPHMKICWEIWEFADFFSWTKLRLENWNRNLLIHGKFRTLTYFYTKILCTEGIILPILPCFDNEEYIYWSPLMKGIKPAIVLIRYLVFSALLLLTFCYDILLTSTQTFCIRSYKIREVKSKSAVMAKE